MIAPASRKIGRFEIRQKLGRGGMADVYLATDSGVGATVALKIVEHADDIDTKEAIEAERRGAELQAHLAAIDPRVVKIYESGDADGFFYVSMEYIDGQDLSELMRRGPLAIEFAVDVAIAVGRTLEHAHEMQVAIAGKNFQGVIHGDIKPRNIRIDARGEVRVLDFGIAKALSLSRRLTRNEFGSVPYASPERLDTGEVNAQSDLWSLAVMLYEMVAGMKPYDGPTTEQVERMIRSRVPAPPAPDPCPDALRKILIKAMAPDPAMRYQTAEEFADELWSFREGRAVAAVAEDLEATRRTHRSEDDETRRTGRGAGLAAAAAQGAHEDDTRATGRGPAAKAAPKKRSGTEYFARAIAVLAMAAILYGAWSAVSSYLLYKHGAELTRQIQTEELTDLDQIWTKWSELSQGNSSSLALRGTRKAVKQKFVEAADRVIGAFRNSDTQPVYERDWERARSELARALAVEPDNTVRGELRLTEGHIARINGSTHKNAAELESAVEKFNEAARLLPQSPDPELGLARVYIYGLRDVDKANDALHEAEKRGYRLSNRDRLQLADGYLARADRLWWDTRNVRGLPQEKDQIQRAEADYNQALETYQSIAPYGNSTAQITRVQSSLESVRSRLDQIENGGDDSIGGVVKPLANKIEDAIRAITGERKKDGGHP